ncbi:hypothetical protein GTO91_11905 [Heliobacterium undosum]|uniref:NERD domain-containing protein n=1 Tax=Heliomicrobium undosum TaxID=121734 RepID=A0A845L1M3_9FIRM|nr:nuclease-related domain-containing protein [Heliomicrobium undosum]MZP30417.1 hypothetical protein [Heliomicrobium undosum]
MRKHNVEQAKRENKGDDGESEVARALKKGLPDNWVVMNDVVVEPDPEVFAQNDHIVVGPQGLFVIETKAWEGSYLAHKDQWKRREGKNWVKCDSPTQQNWRHAQRVGKWLQDTRLMNIPHPMSEWVRPVVVFTCAKWLKANDCSMPVTQGTGELLAYIRLFEKELLTPTQVEKIVTLLQYPRVAKAFSSKAIVSSDVEAEIAATLDQPVQLAQGRPDPSSSAPKGEVAESSSAETVVSPNVSQPPAQPPTEPNIDLPPHEQSTTRDGKAFVRITAVYDDAKRVYEHYKPKFPNIGPLKRDRYKKDTYYFYLA